MGSRRWSPRPAPLPALYPGFRDELEIAIHADAVSARGGGRPLAEKIGQLRAFYRPRCQWR
eukprot:105942-Pyramimonas_sp.AAC.1